MNELAQLRKRIAELETAEAERKRAEEALRESEEKYRAVFESTGTATIIFEEDTTISAANQEFERLSGYSREEVEGKKSWTEFVVPEDLARMKEYHKSRQTDPASVPRNYEFRAVDRQGTTREIFLTVAMIPGTNQRVASLLDITQRKKAEAEIRKLSDYLGSVIDNANVWLDVLDEKADVVIWNKAAEVISGYPRDKVVGHGKIWEWLYPDKEYRQEITARAAAIIRGDSVEDFETLIRTKGGEYRTISWYSRNLIDQKGQPIGSIALGRDVSDRKRAEEEARYQREYFKALFDSSPEAVTSVDMDRRLRDANPAFEKLFGYAVEDIRGKHVPDLVLPKGREKEGRDFIRRVGQGETVAVETVRKAADGREIPVSLLGAPVIVEGKQVGMLGIYRDISERKRAQEAVRESEEKLRLMFECVSEGIVVADLNGNIIEANEKVVQLGRSGSKSDLLGRNAVETITSHDRERASADMQRLMETGGTGTREYTLTRADGSQYPAEISASLLKDTSGNPVGFVSVIRDITERQRAAEERLRLEKLESVGTLAGGIAHDFNNLLVGILSNITLATRYLEPDSRAADSLMEAERASLQARDLTQRLLTFARGSEPVKKLVSLPEFLHDSATFALSGSNVRCRFSLPDDLRPVEVDEGQINQVMSNLVINADEAMPDGGIVDVAARNVTIEAGSPLPLSQGKYVEITVEDHGAGIPGKHLSRIFDPYFSTKQKGSGLGLATTYSIVQKHGGHISVESPPGAGATFHVYLPASRKKAPPKKKKTAETPATAMGRILVMDDSEIVRDALGRGLPSIGYEVEFAKEGAEAVESYARARESGRPFDAVILDLTVPGGMGGKEAVQKLREIDPGVKAIVSSGYSTHPVMAYFKRYGFDDVVVKPYGLEELEEVLGRVVTRTGKAPD